MATVPSWLASVRVELGIGVAALLVAGLRRAGTGGRRG